MLLFLLVGTALAAIAAGQFVGVAPQARLLCIRVGDIRPQPELEDITNAIRLAVQAAVDTGIPSVILLPFTLPVNQEYDDAVRIPTVIWNNPYILMRSTGRQGHRERRPRHRFCWK